MWGDGYVARPWDHDDEFAAAVCGERGRKRAPISPPDAPCELDPRTGQRSTAFIHDLAPHLDLRTQVDAADRLGVVVVRLGERPPRGVVHHEAVVAGRHAGDDQGACGIRPPRRDGHLRRVTQWALQQTDLRIGQSDLVVANGQSKGHAVDEPYLVFALRAIEVTDHRGAQPMAVFD